MAHSAPPMAEVQTARSSSSLAFAPHGKAGRGRSHLHRSTSHAASGIESEPATVKAATRVAPAGATCGNSYMVGMVQHKFGTVNVAEQGEGPRQQPEGWDPL